LPAWPDARFAGFGETSPGDHLVRFAQPVDHLRVDVSWRGQTDVVRVPAPAKRLAFADARIVECPPEHELEMKTVPPNDDAREIRNRPEQDHRLDGDDGMRPECPERVCERLERVLHIG
jgi:hypothetical protein